MCFVTVARHAFDSLSCCRLRSAKPATAGVAQTLRQILMQAL